MHTPHSQVIAHITAALPAGIALAAASDLVDDDPVPYLKILDVGADLIYHAYDLVADDAGVSGGGVGAVVDTHVRTADTGGGHANQDVILFIDNRLFYFNQLQLLRIYNSDRFHN